jgi:hypothetical protein
MYESMHESMHEANPNRVLVENVHMDLYAPIGITPAEVLANAMREAGIIDKTTEINGENPIDLCSSFLEKKSNSQQFAKLTKLGNMLVKNRVITLQDLKIALRKQEKNPNLKLGNILIEMGACTKFDIQNCIDTQNQLREDLTKLDEYQDKINILRKKISSGISTREKL